MARYRAVYTLTASFIALHSTKSLLLNVIIALFSIALISGYKHLKGTLRTRLMTSSTTNVCTVCTTVLRGLLNCDMYRHHSHLRCSILPLTTPVRRSSEKWCLEWVVLGGFVVLSNPNKITHLSVPSANSSLLPKLTQWQKRSVFYSLLQCFTHSKALVSFSDPVTTQWFTLIQCFIHSFTASSIQ